MSDLRLSLAELRRLDLGAPAAERDIDRGLEHYFIHSEAFRRVENRSKTVVLGNRGVGKSAIFKILAAQARTKNAIVLELAPEDYSYELLRTALASEAEGSWAKLGAYAVAWKYLIYVLLMQEIVARGGRRPGRGSLAKINAYVRDNHPTADMSKLSALLSYMKRLEGVKLGPVEASLKARELEKLYKLEEINALLPNIKEVLLKHPALIFVDELDRGWDASEDAKAFVAGLFQACASLNSVSPNLTVYMSLRQELYDNIPALYEDAQKYRDLIETVSWSDEGMRALIAARVRYSIPRLSKVDDDGVWGAVFAETLSYRNTKSFNYMVDRTLSRPREFIQFCAGAIELSVQHESAPPLDYKVISDVEGRHSEDRAKDIAAEYRFQHPGLLSIFEAFRGRVYSLDRSELEDICLELSLGSIAVADDAANWMNDLEPENLIKILWQVGFLRALVSGGIKASRRSGSSYVASYQVGQLNLQNVTRFQVHHMFRAYLGMREPKSRGS
jgi:hypothetical protein